MDKYFASIQAELAEADDDDVRTEEFCTGPNLTFADITAFAVVNGAAEMHGLMTLRKYPKLKEFHDKIAARPRISSRITSRKPDDY